MTRATSFDLHLSGVTSAPSPAPFLRTRRCRRPRGPRHRPLLAGGAAATRQRRAPRDLADDGHARGQPAVRARLRGGLGRPPAPRPGSCRPTTAPGSFEADASRPGPTPTRSRSTAPGTRAYGAWRGRLANIPLVPRARRRPRVRLRRRAATGSRSHRPTCPPTGVTAADRALAADSLRSPLTREQFYFVMADRFANGDPTNDTGGLAGGRLDHGFDPTDKGFFHGGDLAGLLDRLDYIEGLGTTAIWLTPSLQEPARAGHRRRRVAPATTATGSPTSPGSTRTSAPTPSSRRSSTRRTRAASRSSSTSSPTTPPTSSTTRSSSTPTSTRTPSPTATPPATPSTTATSPAPSDFPELDPRRPSPTRRPSAPTPTGRSRCRRGSTTRRSTTTAATRPSPASPRPTATSSASTTSSPSSPTSSTGMTDIYKAWVDFGIDGFRIDTVKHVNMEFWQEFAPAIREHAAAGRQRRLLRLRRGLRRRTRPTCRSFTTEGRLDATLDFGFQDAGVGFAKGGATTRLRDFYAADDYYTDADSNAYASPDLPRQPRHGPDRHLPGRTAR